MSMTLLRDMVVEKIVLDMGLSDSVGSFHQSLVVSNCSPSKDSEQQRKQWEQASPIELYGYFFVAGKGIGISACCEEKQKQAYNLDICQLNL